MKAINIFKAVAYVLALPTMLLTTACSSDEVQSIEQAPASPLGYARPVTIHVNRNADDATRTFYDQSLKKLSFSEGDQLFYGGQNGTSGRYAMLTDYKNGNTFQGTLYTQNPYDGPITDLFNECSGRNYAELIPAGHLSLDYMRINGEGYQMNVSREFTRAFAPTKKIAVEQFFDEVATYFNPSVGFELRATNGVISFTLNGLEPLKTYNFTFRNHNTQNNKNFYVTGTSTSDNAGTATFAIGTTVSSSNTRYYIIIDDGGKYMDIDLGYKDILANHVVNVICDATPKEVVNLSELSAGTYTANHGIILTGTLPAETNIQIADGASVVLRDAVINTGITCVGDGTIILEGENTVQGTGAGIQAGPSGKTLTIKGNGQLTVQGAANCAAIGTGNGGTCGDISIEGGTVIATGGTDAAAIGTGTGGTCGKIYINGGSVDATGNGFGAAIGTGNNGTSGQIVITKNVTSVIAKKGISATHSIGKGSEYSIIGNVTIGGFTGAIPESPYVYPETHVETWTYYDVTTFNLAAGKDYHGLTNGSTLRSNGISDGSVVCGHMMGKFYFIAPYNRKYTNITIKGTCNSVSGTGWTKTEPGAVWSGTPAQYVHVDCDIDNVTQIVLTFQ